LTAGSVLCIPEDGVRQAPVRLQRWLVEEKITVAFAPTVIAESLSQMEWPSETRLRLLLTGGEALRTYPRKNLPFTLVNNYGPTECTVVTTSGPVSAGGDYSSAPAIGRPIDKAELFILGEDLKPLPPGQTGELCVGGPSLARGYRNRPELTAEKFIPNPFDTTPGARLYKTGDLATIRKDGQIQFVGRLDDQIKIRGYRVEPNEIAVAISRNPVVRQCVVLGRGGHDGEKQLIAYIVPSGGAPFSQAEMWAFLRKSLPDYMIPSGFICLDELPLSANGKINLAALPPPGQANIARLEAPDLPRTEWERQITAMVLNLLKLDKIGREENFFLLGGHSLLGAQLIQRLRERFNVEISLRALFESPTVAGIAAEVGHLVSVRSASAAS
jgi:acyl-CoA synthetase (AMP-forming)/AMP-acid ligase II/acyl carrier protein